MKLHNHFSLYSTFGGQKQPWYVWWHQMRDHHYIDLSFHSNHCSRFCTTTKYYSQFFAPFIYSVKWRSIFLSKWDRYVQSISKKSVFVLITSKIGQVYMKTYKFKGKVTVKCQFSVLGKSANNLGYVDISSRKLTWKEGAFCSATDFCYIQKKSIECRRNNI